MSIIDHTWNKYDMPFHTYIDLLPLIPISDFHTSLGTVTIGGLHVLPLWLYGHYHGVLTRFYIPYIIQYLVIGVLAAGRALCAVVEVSMYVKILFDTTTLPDIRLCNVVIIGSHMVNSF